MVQASAMSGLNFAEADPRSRGWWLKARWILDRIEDLNLAQLYQMQHAQHVAVLDYSIDKQAFDGHWGSANDILRDVHSLHFPWAQGDGKKKQQREIDDLLAKWRAKYGDPSDPKVQAHFKKVADAMRRNAATATSEMFKEQKSLHKMVSQTVKSRKKKGKK